MSRKPKRSEPDHGPPADRPPAAETGVNREPQNVVAMYLDRTTSQSAGWAKTLRGVRGMIDVCGRHPAARSSTRVSVALCGPEVTASPYGPFASTVVPELALTGGSPGGHWLRHLVEHLRAEAAGLAGRGVPVNKVIALLMSDFWFDDPAEFGEAVELYRELEGEWGHLNGFFVMTGPNPNREFAARISRKRAPVHLDDLKVDELFPWVSGAVIRSSLSMPGQAVELDPPTWTLADAPRR